MDLKGAEVRNFYKLSSDIGYVLFCNNAIGEH